MVKCLICSGQKYWPYKESIMWMNLVYQGREKLLVTLKLVLVKDLIRVLPKNSIINSILNECLDFVINAIKDRFDQLGYRTLKNLENLLIKAAKGEDYAEELAFVVNCYFDDISESSLSAQLENLTTAFASSTETPTLGTIKEYIMSLSSAQQVGISEICTILKLIMVIPAINAVSERSASALRRV